MRTKSNPNSLHALRRKLAFGVCILGVVLGCGSGDPDRGPEAKLCSIPTFPADAGRLPSFSTKALLSYISEESYGSEDWSSVESVLDELVRRKATRECAVALESGPDFWTTWTFIDVLSRIGGSNADACLWRVATSGTTGKAYFSLMVFAERGEERALQILNANYRQYTVSSVAWVDALTLFGKHGYEPAAENIARDLESAVMNVGCAGQDALRAMYPEASPPTIPGGAEEYWLQYIRKAREG